MAWITKDNLFLVTLPSRDRPRDPSEASHKEEQGGRFGYVHRLSRRSSDGFRQIYVERVRPWAETHRGRIEGTRYWVERLIAGWRAYVELLVEAKRVGF